MDKGFKQFLTKSVIFIFLFVLISFIIGQKIVSSSLLYGFKIFIYGGLGYIFLFSVLGFILLYRERLLKFKTYPFKGGNLIFLLISFISVVSFYILELNISKFTPSLTSIILVHLLFLLIFIFLILGIFGIKFIRDFIFNFKKELTYFLIFGIVVYSLMNLVWGLWSYLSLIVLKISEFILGFFGNTNIIGEDILVFDGFSAKIGEACSGIYSIFIFTSLYLFAVILDWKKLNKIKAGIIFIPAIIGAFFVNILRVFLLFIFGAFISRNLALGLYHSYTGMIFFLIYFGIFWSLSYKWMKR